MIAPTNPAGPDRGDVATPLPAPAGDLWRAGSLVYDRAGLRMLFFWLLWGDFTLMLRERSVGPTFQYMLGTLGASDFVLGVMVGFIPHALGLVLTPIVSFRSDRHRGPRGRRIPYLVVSTPLCFCGMVGLASSTSLGPLVHPLCAAVWGGFAAVAASLADVVPGAAGLAGTTLAPATSTLVIVGLCWTVFEIFAIVNTTIFNALIADVVPHGVMGRFFGLFRMVSLADGIFFSLVLMRYAETRYAAIFLAIGFLFAVSFWLMCANVKEGDLPPPPQDEPWPAGHAGGILARFAAGVRMYLRDCFAHGFYRRLILGVSLTQVAFVPITTFSIFFSKSVGMSPETYGRFCAAQFAVSFGLAYVIGWLADRFHPIRLIVAFYVLHATAVGVGFLAVRDATTFGIIHVVTGACAGIWFTAYASFLPRMVPRGHYATFASAISLVTAMGTMLVAPACGWFLDAMVDHAYRYIYLWSLVFDVAALLVILSVARTFAASGGPRHFVPPDPNGAPAAGAAAGASP